METATGMAEAQVSRREHGALSSTQARDERDWTSAVPKVIGSLKEKALTKKGEPGCLGRAGIK